MQVEYVALMKNQAWVLEDVRADKKHIGCKWVYKMKYKTMVHLTRTKQRWLQRDLLNRKGSITRRHSLPLSRWLQSS
jgi:hypothetical protein